MRTEIRHNERRVSSVIDVPTWDKAKWRGVGYAVIPASQAEVWVCLLFGSEAAARSIFSAWRSRVGSCDLDDIIRITLITGIDRSAPNAYRFVIGSNPFASDAHGKVKQFVSLNRMLRVEPASTTNLDMFKAAYVGLGHYQLMPSVLEGDSHAPIPELGIEKRHLRLVPAWQIGEHDLDATGIASDDVPIIPSDVDEVPVKRLLESARRSRNWQR